MVIPLLQNQKCIYIYIYIYIYMCVCVCVCVCDDVIKMVNLMER
jgi:hypothetical protein